MIAADTSSLVAFFEGDEGKDTSMIEAALNASSLFLPSPVITELLSDPKLPKDLADSLLNFPLLEVKDGFWIRSGILRAKVFAKGRKARLGDALIAQQCIDNNIPLITRDKDFSAFSAVSNIKLL